MLRTLTLKSKLTRSPFQQYWHLQKILRTKLLTKTIFIITTVTTHITYSEKC